MEVLDCAPSSFLVCASASNFFANLRLWSPIFKAIDDRWGKLLRAESSSVIDSPRGTFKANTAPFSCLSKCTLINYLDMYTHTHTFLRGKKSKAIPPSSDELPAGSLSNASRSQSATNSLIGEQRDPKSRWIDERSWTSDRGRKTDIAIFTALSMRASSLSLSARISSVPIGVESDETALRWDSISFKISSAHPLNQIRYRSVDYKREHHF